MTSALMRRARRILAASVAILLCVQGPGARCHAALSRAAAPVARGVPVTVPAIGPQAGAMSPLSAPELSASALPGLSSPLPVLSSLPGPAASLAPVKALLAPRARVLTVALVPGGPIRPAGATPGTAGRGIVPAARSRGALAGLLKPLPDLSRKGGATLRSGAFTDFMSRIGLEPGIAADSASPALPLITGPRTLRASGLMKSMAFRLGLALKSRPRSPSSPGPQAKSRQPLLLPRVSSHDRMFWAMFVFIYAALLTLSAFAIAGTESLAPNDLFLPAMGALAGFLLGKRWPRAVDMGFGVFAIYLGGAVPVWTIPFLAVAFGTISHFRTSKRKLLLPRKYRKRILSTLPDLGALKGSPGYRKIKSWSRDLISVDDLRGKALLGMQGQRESTHFLKTASLLAREDENESVRMRAVDVITDLVLRDAAALKELEALAGGAARGKLTVLHAKNRLKTLQENSIVPTETEDLAEAAREHEKAPQEGPHPLLKEAEELLKGRAASRIHGKYQDAIKRASANLEKALELGDAGRIAVAEKRLKALIDSARSRL